MFDLITQPFSLTKQNIRTATESGFGKLMGRMLLVWTF